MDLNTDIKLWAKKHSPAAEMMLSLSDAFEVIEEDASQAVTVFLDHWPKIRDSIAKENKKRNGKCTLYEYKIKWPPKKLFPKKYEKQLADMEELVQIDFFNLIQSINDYMNNTEHYQEIIDCSNDFLELFDWSEDERSRFIGDIGSAMCRIDPEEGEAYFRKQLEGSGHNEVLTGYYTFELLAAKRWEDAAKALEGYEDSDDIIIRERFRWLKERN